MNTAFLNCNIWSVYTTKQLHNNFYLYSAVYHYNSLLSGIVMFDPECVQIPEFEIADLHLLNDVDFNSIDGIPIICNIDGNWKIDLTIYENFKLQSTNIQSN
jgi:hypothetical protein